MTVIPTRLAATHARMGLLVLLCLAPVAALLYGVHNFTVGNYLACAGFAGFFTMFLLAAIHGLVNWDAERSGLRVAAFAWGAGVATLVAIFLETRLAQTGLITMHTGITVFAPIIEEIIKVVGLLLILLVTRGRANAFLLALMIGLGFATYENTQYLAQALTHDGYSHEFFALIISRGLDGTFIHAVCTGIFGLALHTVRGYKRLWALPGALMLSIVLHAVCNGAFGLVGNALVETIVIVAAGAGLLWVQRRLTRGIGGQGDTVTALPQQMADRL